jgi:DNA repair protein RadC
MPGQGAEQGGKKAAPSFSLREYWTHPTGRTEATRRSVQREPATNLFEHANPLPLSAQKPLAMRDGVTQPALPLTWYAAETPLATHAMAETTQPLHELQERVERYGVQTLSNAELLTIVLRTASANESVVGRVHSLLTIYSVEELLQVEFGELYQQHALSKAKATQVQALLEVARRLTRLRETEKFTINSPADAATLLIPEMAHLDHEEMRVLVLNTKNGVVANLLLYQGTVNSSVLRSSEIFRPAVTRKCPGILIAHNHPSGDPTPSPEDIAVTEQLVQAGNHLDLEMIDHLIIGKNNRYVSLKERMRW